MLPDTIKKCVRNSLCHKKNLQKELNVSVLTINRWETGKAKPNLIALKSLKHFCETNDLTFDVLESEWLKDTQD